MGVSAAIFYAIVIACPIIYGIRQLVLFIIKQVKAHKAWKMEYEEYEETHEEELYWRVKRKLDEPAERRKREMDNTAYFPCKYRYSHCGEPWYEFYAWRDILYNKSAFCRLTAGCYHGLFDILMA